MKTMPQKNISEYSDIRYILPTSNIFERQFSVAGYGMSHIRKRTLLADLES